MQTYGWDIMPKRKPPMGAVHRTLRLQHHSHTGRLLHHKHTSFHGLAIIIVLAAAFMTGLNMIARATADDIYIYASNPAPIPADPASITAPHDGDTVYKSTVPVSGTCPQMSPLGVVLLLDNGVQAGSAPCNDNFSFALPIVVTPGQHKLVARIYTSTGDPGTDSTPVDITYLAPSAVTSEAAAAAAAEEQSGSPLTVTIDEPFIIFSPEKDAVWSGTITGGTLPYKVHINWGDGSSSDYTVTKSGQQRFSHHYHSMESHQIVLRVIDASGRGVMQNYAAVTQYRPPVTGIGSSTLPTPRAPFRGSTPLALYGAYLVLIAIFGYAWLKLHPHFAYAKLAPAPSTNYPRTATKRHKKANH